VAGSGTGGTLAGVATYLKERNPACRCILADPPGSGLYNKVVKGVMYASTEAEGTRRRHQVDTIMEGIGLNRITKNFQRGLDKVDGAFKVADKVPAESQRPVVIVYPSLSLTLPLFPLSLPPSGSGRDGTFSPRT